jgi:hypothetical protein
MDISRLKFILPLLVCLSVCPGCSVKLVSDYDQSTADELIRIAKKVDMFYGNMSELPDIEREYGKYSKDYVDIESDIRSLVIRNRMRPLNDESIKISETILTEFVKYRKSHKEENLYKNTLLVLHRNRLLRLFTAMSIAEQAKQINSEDKNGSSN